MRTQPLRALALALLLTAVLTGCYKSAGGKIEPTEAGRTNDSQAVSNTQIPMPTFTQQPAATEVLVQPTQEQATALPSPIPSNTPTQPPQPTATATFRPAPNVQGQGGQNVTQVAVAPTFTQQAAVVASPFPTQIPLPSATPTFRPAPTQFPTLIPTQPPTVGPTASFTPFSQEAVPLAERPTETLAAIADGQGGPVGPLPTFTPYFVPTLTVAVPTQTPAEVAQVATLTTNQMTATAIVANATATAAWLQGTRTAPVQPGQPTAIPGVIVTATPAFYPTAAPAGQCGSYLIQPGDTLSRISLSYNVTTAQMAQANNITNADLILAGSTLIVPCPTAVVATAVPNTSGQGGQGGVTTTTTGQSIYIVEPGDNIYRLSLRFGVSMADLMRVNGLSASTMNTIYAGQELIIPPGGTTTTTGQPGTIVQPTPGQVIQPTPFQQAQPGQVVPAG